MALTEQDFLGIIQKHIGGFNFTGKENAAKAIHYQHLAECERIAELAFNAANEAQVVEISDNLGIRSITHSKKYPTYQSYKDSQPKP